MFYGNKFTTTATTPQRLSLTPMDVNRIIFTVLPGSGVLLTYVLSQPVDPTNPAAPITKTDQSLVTELGPSTATAPGTPFVIERLAGQPPLNLQDFGVGGSHDGDAVQVSWEVG